MYSMSRGQMIFQAAEIRIHHLGIALEGKNERNVDIDADSYRFTNGRDTFLGSGYLHHQIRTADSRPELFNLGHGGSRIVRQLRANLDAHVSVAAICLFIKRTK